MADTKISALTAAAAPILADEFAINEAGTSKRLTLQQALNGVDLLADAAALAGADKILVTQSAVAKDATLTTLRSFMRPTIITGNSGTVDQSDIGATTIQILTSDNSDIPTTTVVTQLTASTMGVGWWLIEYWVIWQSDVSTTGITFIVDHSGTAANSQSSREDIVGSTTALATIGRANQASNLGVTGALPSHWTSRTDGGALGPNEGVDLVDVNQMTRITALILVTVSGNLLLRANSEIAATATRVMAGTMARYTRLS